MPVLHVPAPLRSLCGGCDRIEVEGATLRAVFTAVALDYPELTERILDEHGLRPDIAVAIDGSILDQSGLTNPVAPDADIYLVPPIGGGCSRASITAR
jgi:molybdopterin converting factor small subunit